MENQVGFATATGQAWTPGVQGFSNASAPLTANPNTVSPNAIRWMFNPFAFVDISNRPISGHARLQAGSFIPITSQTNRISLSGLDKNGREVGPGIAAMQGGRFTDQLQPQGVAEPSVSQNQFAVEVRTAFAISSEIEDSYADKGVKVLESMTGFTDDEAVRVLHRELISGGLSYKSDSEQPEYPVPNLIILENYLLKEASKTASAFTGDLAVNPTAIISDILVSVRTAISHCRTVTREAKRVVANKTIGYSHTFDAYASRCFIALGEVVPSDLGEMYGKTQETTIAQPNAELERLRAENEELKAEAANREMSALRAEIEALKAQTITVQTATIEKVIARCDYVKADGSACKGAPVTGDTRCRHHLTAAVESDAFVDIQGE